MTRVVHFLNKGGKMNCKKFFPNGALALSLLSVVFSSSAIENTHIKGGYETPHIKWELPNKNQKKRVLFFNNYHHALGRYPAELEQRFNIDYTAVYWNYGPFLQWDYKGNPLILGGDEGIARAEALIRDGNFDAFVFWGCNPGAILSKSKKAYLLMAQQIARNGAGIVVIDASADPKLFKEKNLLKGATLPFPGYKLKEAYYTVGKGRGVLINGFDAESLEDSNRTLSKKRAIEYCEGWREMYELRLGDVYKALRWAMHSPLPKINMGFADGKFSATPEFEGKNVKMELFLSGEGDTWNFAKDLPVVSGKSVEYKVSPVPGRYLAGMILREDGKVIGFGQEFIEVKRSSKAPEVKLDKKFGIAGTKVTGNAVWSGGGEATLRFRDRYRRILSERKLSGGSAKFEFVPDETFGHVTTVELAVPGKDGKDSDRDYAYFMKSGERKGMFDVMAWGFHQFSMSSIDAEQRLHDIGVNELVQAYGGAFSPVEMLWISGPANLFITPDFRDESKCWSNPEVLKKLYEKYKKITFGVEKGCKRAMYMDEGPGQLGCLSSHCRKAYQEFLKKKYGEIGKLNAAWGSSYKNWDEVDVSRIPPEGDAMTEAKKYIQIAFHSPGFAHILHTWTVKDKNRWMLDSFANQEMGSLLAKNYPRWFDRMQFNNAVMLKCFDTVNMGIADSGRPDLVVGISGGGSTNAEMNMGKWIEKQNCILLYSNYQTSNPVTSLADSIRKPTESYNSWTGYKKTPEPMISEVWTDMLSRPSYLPIYSVFSSPPNYYGILKPDFSQNAADKGFLDSTARLRNGLADVLNRSARKFDPIGILWSWESNCANGLEGGESYEYRGRAHAKAFHFADELGFKPRYQTVDRLMNGTNSLSDYKVLFLPRTDAISDKLAAMLEEFVKNGGTVIADVRPGVFDENLKLRKEGVCDGLFGIKRAKLAPRKASTLNMPGSDKLKFELDPEVKTTTGIALYHSPENIPAVIVSPYGKGKFVLLNFPFSSMPSFASAAFKETGVPQGIRDMIPLKPSYVITAKGKNTPRFRTAEWKSGELTYLYMHDDKLGVPPSSYSVTLPEAAFLYAADEDKQLPKAKTHTIRITPPHAALLVISDKALSPLEVKIPPSVKRGERIEVSFKTASSQKGLRPAVLTVERDGKRFSEFRKVIMVSEKSSSVPFKVALNELPGNYAFILTDTVTEKRSKASFNLK